MFFLLVVALVLYINVFAKMGVKENEDNTNKVILKAEQNYNNESHDVVVDDSLEKEDNQFDDYLNILNPNFGNIKFYNLYTNKGFFVYQDKYKSLSFDAIKEKIKGTPKLTENEKEYVEKYGYREIFN